MGFNSGQKNTVFDSIRHCLLTPPLSFRTDVILIETWGRSRTFPSIFHISLKSQVKPWGLSLECCSGCGFDHYLDCDPISSSIICLNCDSNGVVECSQTWQVDVSSQVRQEFWVSTLSNRGPLPIQWKSVRTPHYSCDRDTDTETGQTIQALRFLLLLFDASILIHSSQQFCSSCKVTSCCQKCSFPNCKFAICIGSGGESCLAEFDGQEIAWFCPLHTHSSQGLTPICSFHFGIFLLMQLFVEKYY